MTAPAPRLFGPPDRQLFGMLHRPPAEVPVRLGVVLTGPFGQEAIRAHRMLRVLADRLARAGALVLRVDPYGSGDAGGDDSELTLAGWAGDLRVSLYELAGLAGPGAVTCLLGMGLGATAAWLAAAGAAVPPSRLVLWDPVLDGATYLAHLQRRHDDTVAEAMDVPHPAVRPAIGLIEAIGFAVSPVLAGELTALRPEAWPALPAGTRCAVLSESAADGARLPPGCRHEVLAHGIDWTTENADNQSLVPTQALLRLAALAGEAA